jgi:hypothetical protein
MQSSDTLQSRKKSWHFSIEKDFVCDESLSPMARMLYIILMSFASPTSPVPFPGMRLLGRLLHCTEDTVRKYRKELEQHAWIDVEHRRDGHNKFSRNAYILLDGPEPGAVPKKPGMENFSVGEIGSRKNTGIKSLPVGEEETREAKSHKQQQYRASGDGGDADDVPTPSAVKGPRSSAETFIKNFKEWGKEARITATVIPAERTALQEFFTDNPEVTPYGSELFALMLCAWIVPVDLKVEGTDYNPFWHCNQKSKRMPDLPGVPASDHRKRPTGLARMIAKQYRLPQERCSLQQKAAA